MRMNLDNPVIHALARAYDILYATALFLLGCLPVVTLGASYTAMHATMMSIAADSCSGVWTQYTAVFRDNFSLSTKLWLASLPLGALVFTNIGICFVMELPASPMLSILRGLTVFTTALYASIFIYVFAGLSRFYVTWKQALSNALIWTVKKLHWTLCLLAITLLMALCVYLAWFWALPAVALGLYVQARTLNRVFGLKPEKCTDENPSNEDIHYD